MVHFTTIFAPKLITLFFNLLPSECRRYPKSRIVRIGLFVYFVCYHCVTLVQINKVVVVVVVALCLLTKTVQ